MKSAAAILTGVFMVTFCAALSSASANELTNCQKNFNEYLKAPGHKAFATTLGNDPGYHPASCFAVTGYSLKKLAENKAVSECNRVRRKMDGGKCRVIDSR
jgi:hypothetical protein